jgi:hypothetical protein
MSDTVDKNTLLRIALDDENVQAAVADVCTVATFPAESEMSGPVTITRPAQPTDYAAAVIANIDKFDGLTEKDIVATALAPLVQ